MHSWHRFGSFVQAFLALEFLIATPRFVDDLFSADRDQDGDHEFAGPAGVARCVRRVIRLLGWELDPKKSVQHASTTTMLGVCVAAWPGSIVFWIGREKLEKWLKCIDNALESGFLRPAEAKRLAGRLSWGNSVVFGRGARAYLAALHWAPRAVQAQGRPGGQGWRLAPEIPYLCAERLIAFRTLIWALSVRSGV